MALSWVLLVVVFALHNGFSEAANNTTTTTASAPPTTSLVSSTTQNPAATTSTTDAATSTTDATTSTTAVASPTADATTSTTDATTPATTAGPSGFYTYLKGSFKSSECTAAKNNLLNSTVQNFFTNQVFDLMGIKFVVNIDTCQYNFTITFGPDLKIHNISEVFEAELKSLSGTLNLTDIKAGVYVEGVELGDFKAGADDCKKKCCNGAGGPITLYRTCLPSNKCRSYKKKFIESDCMNVCSDVCAGVMCKISLLVLFFGVSMNWFLK